MDAGKITVQNRSFSLKKVLESAIQMQFFNLQSKQIQLETHFCAELDTIPNVIGDEGKLFQIMTNLYGNAIKYTEKGNIRIDCNLFKESNDIELNVTVQDTGIGIPKDKLNFIFEEFSRVNHPQSHSVEGSGLGLAIVAKLIKMLHGSLRVASQEEEGSCFSFTLRYLIDHEKELTHAPAPTPQQEQVQEPRQENLVILVAEDNVLNQQILEKRLEKLGHKVIMTENGMQCYEKFVENENQIDLILLDIQMPIMNGFECAKMIRKHQGLGIHVPIVAVSGFSYQSDLLQMKLNEIDGYLAKPISKEVLDWIIKTRHTRQTIESTQGNWF